MAVVKRERVRLKRVWECGSESVDCRVVRRSEVEVGVYESRDRTRVRHCSVERYRGNIEKDSSCHSIY